MGLMGMAASFTPQGKAVQGGSMVLQLVTGLCAIIFLGVCMGWVMEKSKGSKADSKKLGNLQRSTMAFSFMTLIFGFIAFFAQHAMNSL